MSTVKKIFAISICRCKEDISKNWFVKIKVPDYINGRFVWKKCYGDINKYKTIEERNIECDKLAKEIDVTQQYSPAQGSRKHGYKNENLYTDTITQLKQQLEIRCCTVKPTSAAKYTDLLNNLDRWLIKNDTPNLPVGAFNNSHAMLFVQHLRQEKYSNQSCNDHIQFLRSLFKKLIPSIILVNPFDMKGFKNNSVPAMYYQQSQTQDLKDEIMNKDPQLWLSVQFLYYCFIRPKEARLLKVEDILIGEAKIRVREEVSKNGKLQYVSIPHHLLNKLQEMDLLQFPTGYYLFSKNGKPGENPLGVNNMRNRHRYILTKLKWKQEKHQMYSWKHTGAVASAKAGISLKDLQMQLRHHSLDQVDAYLRQMLVHESDFIKYNFPEI